MPKILLARALSIATAAAVLTIDIRHYVEESAPVEERPAAAVPVLQPMPAQNNALKEEEKKLRDAFTAGQFALAKTIIEEQLNKPNLPQDYKAWLKKQHVIVRTALAWTSVQKRDCASAQDELRGLDLDEAPVLAAKALGFCSMQEKDWVSAQQYLEYYTEHQSGDAEGYMLLSSVKEAQGSLNEAIELNDKALGLDASSKKLAMKAESLSAQQEESMTQAEIRSGAIRLRYQAPMQYDLAQSSIEIINETLQRLNTELGLDYPASTIEVVFHRTEHFEKITHGPAWASALYDGEIRIPVPDEGRDLSKMAEVLRHEITHAVLDEQTKKKPLPSWFQEGLAQIMECGTLCWSYPFAVTTHPFLPADVFNKSFLEMSSRDAQVAYKQSRYLMSSLYRSKGTQGIREIISRFSDLPSLDSENLLGAVDWTYKGLYEEAARNWAAQRSL